MMLLVLLLSLPLAIAKTSLCTTDSNKGITAL
jgi:hypothetical protein